MILAFALRGLYLKEYPGGLYSDEAALGYNSYLLSYSGKDEFGRNWPVALQSFGDWKPPMQAWVMLPFIKIFGLNEFSVRIPGAILGTITVWIIYFLAKNLFSEKMAWLAALLLAINPWHIFMSRVAMLVGVEVFFVSFGVLCLIKGLKNGKWWILAAVNFGGAIYSYYGSRVTVLLIFAIFVLVYYNELRKKWWELVIPVLVGSLVLLPLGLSFIKEPLVLTGRAKTTSIFFDDNVRLSIWDGETTDGLKNVPIVVTRIFHNKPLYYARDIANRWLSHFSPIFLFVKGDNYPPFKIPGMGYLHIVDFPLFLFGILLLYKKRDRSSRFILGYLLIAPLVASLTFMTPAGNRSFNLVIPWTLITAYGLSRFKYRMTAGIVLLYFLSLAFFFYSYIYLIQREIPDYWHYGRREMILKLEKYRNQGQKIYWLNAYSQPYIFFAFYWKMDLADFLQNIQRAQGADELGWEWVDSLMNIQFPREKDKIDQVVNDKEALFVDYGDKLQDYDMEVINSTSYPDGTNAYRLLKWKN